jgi:hypothetical protein
MFIRWKATQPRQEKWFNRGDGPYFRAYLVESVRVNGKPRQKQHYLGAIKNGCLDQTYDQAMFWQHAYKSMESLQLSEEQQEAIKAEMQKRVPIPSREAIEEYNKQLHQINVTALIRAEARTEKPFHLAYPNLAAAIDRDREAKQRSAYKS